MDAAVREKGDCLFGPFRLDATHRVLTRDGQPIALTPTVMDLLIYLVENPGRVVTKAELLDALWPGRFVEESNVRQAIFSLRRALGPAGEKIIATAPGRGYRFAETVRREGLASSSSEVRSAVVAPRRGWPRARWAWAAVGLLVLAGVATAGWLLRRPAQTIGPGHTVVIADFLNQTGDPLFDRTLGSVLRVDLSQSPYLDILTERHAEDTLALMTKPRDTPLTAALAQEVCTRDNGDAVVAGMIGLIGGRYVLTLTATDCSGDRTFAAEKEEVQNRADVVPALDRLMDRARAKLGESLSSIKQFNVPLIRQRTASLEALRAYSEAVWLSNRGHLVEAISFDQRAIALDPDFAAAYAGLGAIDLSLFDTKGGADNFRKAYGLRDTLNEREKLLVTSLQDQFVLKDFDKAIADLQSWTSIYPLDVSAWSNLANAEDYIGRHDQAVQDGKHGLALTPVFETPYVVMARAELRAGHIEDAKATAALAERRGFSGDPIHRELMRIALAEGDAAGVAREAEWARTAPYPRGIVGVEGETALSHGQVKTSTLIFDRLTEMITKQGATDYALGDRERALAEFGLDEQARSLIARPNDETNHAYLLAVAKVGDMRRAETLLDQQVRDNPSDTLLTRDYAPQVRAVLALRRGRPLDAVAALRPAMPYEPVDLEVPYILGIARLAAGDGPGAASAFQTALDHRCWYPETALYPLSKLGMARALRLENNIPAAKRYYAAFLADWSGADPGIPLLATANAELKRLQ